MKTYNEIQAILKYELEKFGEKTRSLGPAELYDPINYILSIGGKRIRPALCLMASDLFNGDIQEAIMPALALEIFHSFTLLHDDIMDNSSVRRGKPTVHEKWSTNIAILSGDAMCIKAYEYLQNVPDQYLRPAYQLFTKTALEVCEGQQYDMNFELQESVSIAQYLEMIRLKTSVLLAASLKMGGIFANASAEDQEELYRFGINMGLAFQLQDDYLDAFGDPKVFGKEIGNDIISNKKTYLLIKALELAQEKHKNELKYWIGKDLFDEEEKIDSVLRIYHEIGIEEVTQTQMTEYHDAAIEALDAISVHNSKKTELRRLAVKLLVRSS